MTRVKLRHVATAIVATTPTANPTATDDDSWPLDELLAARVLSLTAGLEGLGDDDLLRVAGAAAATGGAFRAAALGHPPLAAPTAVLCVGSGPISAGKAWWRAVAACRGERGGSRGGLLRQLRCVRLSWRALLRPLVVGTQYGG